jgi:peptide/nickel transport system permease protein
VERLIVRRLLLCLPTLFGITLVAFALSRLAPGGPLTALLDPGEGVVVPREQVAAAEKALGFDRPLHEQYLDWLGGALRLDFGESLQPGHRAVTTRIAEAAQVSVALQAVAALLIYALGIPLGIWCAARAGRRAERVVGESLFVLHAMPSAVIGTLLIALFCTGLLGRLPLVGLTTPGAPPEGAFARALDVARHAVLPIACLVLGGVTAVVRYARAGMLEALRQPWIAAARARGLPERRVLLVHALRSGVLPLVTLLGYLFPWLVSGSVVVENVFALPGLGRLTVEAVMTRDYPTVMALSLLAGVATLLGFVLSDLLHAKLRRREATP